MTKDHQPGTRGSAIVVGASLAGLMSALTLSRIGLRVTMLERSTRKVRTVRARGVVIDGVVQRTLRAGDVPDTTLDELADEAREIWPNPWREAIVDCISRRAVIGTPIGEYLPHRLVSGRVCLVGDAAHLSSPMTGSGFDASAQDALALADALGGNGDPGSISDALRRYEAARLDAARQLVHSGQSFNNSFAPRGASQ